MSRAERVKDCITAVTPKSRAARRFSQSRGVRGGASYSRPSTVRPLREPRVPPRSTRARRGAVTSSSIAPSSSSRRIPGSSSSMRRSGRGRPPAPSSSVSPSARQSGRSSGPVLSSGPCVSMSSSGLRPRLLPALNSASSQGSASDRPM